MTTLNYALCALYTCFLALHHCSNTTYDDDATTVNLAPFLFRATRLHMYSNISSTPVSYSMQFKHMLILLDMRKT
jgi:hypothetical protein